MSWLHTNILILRNTGYWTSYRHDTWKAEGDLSRNWVRLQHGTSDFSPFLEFPLMPHIKRCLISIYFNFLYGNTVSKVFM